MKTEIFTQMSHRPRCQKCNRPTEAHFVAHGTGWSGGETIRHHPDCETLRCEHGERVWGPDGNPCDVEDCASNRNTADEGDES